MGEGEGSCCKKSRETLEFVATCRNLPPRFSNQQLTPLKASPEEFMHTLFSIALLSFALSSSGYAQTTVKFDKFKNTTQIMASQTLAGHVTFDNGTRDASLLIQAMNVIVGFACEGQVESCHPSSIELLFIATTSDWHMSGGGQVNLLIDGKPASAGKASWDGQVLGADDLREYLDTNISPELLIKLAKAKTVDVQIGLFDFSLTDKNFAALKDVTTHVVSITETKQTQAK
jgi:hypothetical protein